MALTKIPILIIYGDNIPDNLSPCPQDSWRVRLAMAREWRDGEQARRDVNDASARSGNQRNTPFFDLNNVQIADLVSKFLKNLQ